MIQGGKKRGVDGDGRKLLCFVDSAPQAVNCETCSSPVHIALAATVDARANVHGV